jgi:hypothetical protein
VAQLASVPDYLFAKHCYNKKLFSYKAISLVCSVALAVSFIPLVCRPLRVTKLTCPLLCRKPNHILVDEGRMGDSPVESLHEGKLSNESRNIRAADSNPHTMMADHHVRLGQHPMSSHTNQSANYQQNQSYQAQFSSPHRADAFNMGNIGTTLPEVQYHNYNSPAEQQRQQGHTGTNYQMQNMPQFSGQPAQNSTLPTMPYSPPYQGQFQGMYPPHQASSQHVPAAAGTAGTFFQGQGYIGQVQQQHQIPQYFVPPGQYVNHTAQVYLPGAGQHVARGAFSDSRQVSPQMTDFLGGFPRVGGQGRCGSMGMFVDLGCCVTETNKR